jgi:hypothetical protein
MFLLVFRNKWKNRESHYIKTQQANHASAPPRAAMARRGADPSTLRQALPRSTELLKGCDRVYLDIGLNQGDFLRALYDTDAARSRATAAHSRAFSSFYGDVANRSDVCAVAFEPNPKHGRSLAALQARLRRAGHPASIFGLAVSNVSGTATYWTDTAEHNLKQGEWGSSLLRWAANMDDQHTARVPTLTLQSVLAQLLLPGGAGGGAGGGAAGAESRRRRPAGRPRGRPLVGMKMDCEGCEYDAVPPALDLLCATVDELWLERHDRFFSRRWRGHKEGFTSGGRVESLDASMRELSGRRAAGACRTTVRQLSRFEFG